jgi:hypothetical protein
MSQDAMNAHYNEYLRGNWQSLYAQRGSGTACRGSLERHGEEFLKLFINSQV